METEPISEKEAARRTFLAEKQQEARKKKEARKERKENLNICATYIAHRKAEKAENPEKTPSEKTPPAPTLSKIQRTAEAATRRHIWEIPDAFKAFLCTTDSAITVLTEINPAEITLLQTLQTYFANNKYPCRRLTFAAILKKAKELVAQESLEVVVSAQATNIISFMRINNRHKIAIISNLKDAYISRVGNLNSQLISVIAAPPNQ
jgi:hypothetical protein